MFRLTHKDAGRFWFDGLYATQAAAEAEATKLRKSGYPAVVTPEWEALLLEAGFRRESSNSSCWVSPGTRGRICLGWQGVTDHYYAHGHTFAEERGRDETQEAFVERFLGHNSAVIDAIV